MKLLSDINAFIQYLSNLTVIPNDLFINIYKKEKMLLSFNWRTWQDCWMDKVWQTLSDRVDGPQLHEGIQLWLSGPLRLPAVFKTPKQIECRILLSIVQILWYILLCGNLVQYIILSIYLFMARQRIYRRQPANSLVAQRRTSVVN